MRSWELSKKCRRRMIMDNLKKYTYIAVAGLLCVFYAGYMRQRTLATIYQREAQRQEILRLRNELEKAKTKDTLSLTLRRIEKRLDKIEND